MVTFSTISETLAKVGSSGSQPASSSDVKSLEPKQEQSGVSWPWPGRERFRVRPHAADRAGPVRAAAGPFTRQHSRWLSAPPQLPGRGTKHKSQSPSQTPGRFGLSAFDAALEFRPSHAQSGSHGTKGPPSRKSERVLGRPLQTPRAAGPTRLSCRVQRAVLGLFHGTRGLGRPQARSVSVIFNIDISSIIILKLVK